jgi:hypothetical protein
MMFCLSLNEWTLVGLVLLKISVTSNNNRGYLSTPSKPDLFYSRPFHGELLPEPFEVGRGSAPPMAGNGPAVRGSSVQGFPCRYYDWRVLDEHFERGFRQRAKQFTQSRGLPSGTGGIKKRRTGGLRIAFLSTKTRFDDRPSSHNANNSQTRDEGVARGNPG